jgi:hypothetical protein
MYEARKYKTALNLTLFGLAIFFNFSHRCAKNPLGCHEGWFGTQAQKLRRKLQLPFSRKKKKIKYFQRLMGCHAMSAGKLLPSFRRTTVPSSLGLDQRFPNFFQVGTTFISQNVLRTPLLLSALKANCLRFSTTVCDTQFTLILFVLSFLD